MTAYVKHKTSNCGACVNDAIYLFYSIFFMSLPRHVLGKTIFLGKAIYLGKAISLTAAQMLAETKVAYGRLVGKNK